MIPGVPRISQTSNSGLHQIRKPRFARRESTILSRMFAKGAGIPPVSSHVSPEVMRRRFAENQRWQDDLNRSTSLSSSDLQTASSSSSFSEVADRSAGKSTVDDEISVSGGKNKRSTATTAYGVISLMGRRREMEDAVTAVPSLTQNLGSSAYHHGFFAVYDGNGGFGVAEKRKERLHHLVAEQLAEEIGDLTMHEVEPRVDWERVMKQSFARMDREVICGKEVETSGTGERRKVEGKKTQSTALVAVVGVEEIVVANCGDSMAVLCQDGVAIPLSRHHKGGIPDEGEKVEGAGGSVVDYSSPHEFATSSSIGEHCTRPYVISVPEVTVYRRTQLDEFLILASDGLWDVVSSDMACELVKRFLLHEQCRRMQVCAEEEDDTHGEGEGYANHVATMLAEMAISRGSKDNVSVAVVMLC